MFYRLTSIVQLKLRDGFCILACLLADGFGVPLLFFPQPFGTVQVGMGAINRMATVRTGRPIQAAAFFWSSTRDNENRLNITSERFGRIRSWSAYSSVLYYTATKQSLLADTLDVSSIRSSELHILFPYMESPFLSCLIRIHEQICWTTPAICIAQHLISHSGCPNAPSKSHSQGLQGSVPSMCTSLPSKWYLETSLWTQRFHHGRQPQTDGFRQTRGGSV